VGLLIPLVFAISGSWINLWLYFGGANQLLAGLALMLIAIHLARAHAPTAWTFWPATFMIVTTLAALLWETWYFLSHVLSGQPLANPPLDAKPYHGLALFLNGVFVVVGIALLVLGIRMAIMSYAAYNRFRQRPAPVPRPSEAAGD
jgi:carbon starvation protein